MAEQDGCNSEINVPHDADLQGETLDILFSAKVSLT